VLYALEKGKHCICEKPLGLNEKEVTEMVEKAIFNGELLESALSLVESPKG
jgi:predicted dehydrogenase